MNPVRYETNLRSTLSALGLAIISSLGISGVAACLIILSWDQDQPQNLTDFLGALLPITGVLFLSCLVGIIAMLVMWTPFHRLGVRDWRWACSVGYATGTALLLLVMPAAGAALVGLVLSVLGLIAWRVAYRKVQP